MPYDPKNDPNAKMNQWVDRKAKAKKKRQGFTSKVERKAKLRHAGKQVVRSHGRKSTTSLIT